MTFLQCIFIIHNYDIHHRESVPVHSKDTTSGLTEPTNLQLSPRNVITLVVSQCSLGTSAMNNSYSTQQFNPLSQFHVSHRGKFVLNGKGDLFLDNEQVKKLAKGNQTILTDWRMIRLMKAYGNNQAQESLIFLIFQKG